MLAHEPTITEVIIGHIASLGVDPSRIETNNLDMFAVTNDKDVICLFVDVSDSGIRVYKGLESVKLQTNIVGDALTAISAVMSEPNLYSYNPYSGI